MPSPLPPRRLLTPVLALLLFSAGAAVRAETNPYYLGISESLAHDSNLYRLGDAVGTPTTIASRSDSVLTSALFGGIDRSFGRQHVSGQVTLRNNRYRHNDSLNYNGYGANLGWDWESVNRLSGNVTAGANRSLRRFDASEQGLNPVLRNVETTHNIDAVVRLGVVTRLTAEASVGWRSGDYSSPAYAGYTYRQQMAGIGAHYQWGGRLTLGTGLRQSRTTFPNGGDGNTRHDLDLTAQWQATGASTVSARLSHTATDYNRSSSQNFSGTTGELQAQTSPTGRLRLGARLSHDTGLSSSLFSLGQFVGTAQFNRSTDALRLTADYELSAKVLLNASIDRARRDLSSALTSSFVLGGRDTTTVLGLGASWQPTRAVQVGCQAAREQRTTDGTVSLPYRSNALSCFGQMTIK